MPSPLFYDIMRYIHEGEGKKRIAEFAHFHKGEEMELKQGLTPGQREIWDKAFSYVECMVPPPRHPVRPDDGLSMEFRVSNKVLGVIPFWLTDAGELSAEPANARLIPLGWKSIRETRDELRTHANDGIRHLRQWLRAQGVPTGAIYDNSQP